jgi:hypothetical protein
MLERNSRWWNLGSFWLNIYFLNCQDVTLSSGRSQKKKEGSYRNFTFSFSIANMAKFNDNHNLGYMTKLKIKNLPHKNCL